MRLHQAGTPAKDISIAFDSSSFLHLASLTVLSTLHWLPTKHRIDFKILLITYKALNGLAPQYLSELLLHYSPSRPLHSQNSGHLIIPRISKSTAGGRSFSYLAPKLWNNLPNTVREADTLCQFKSRLKTHLFNPLGTEVILGPLRCFDMS